MRRRHFFSAVGILLLAAPAVAIIDGNGNVISTLGLSRALETVTQRPSLGGITIGDEGVTLKLSDQWQSNQAKGKDGEMVHTLSTPSYATGRSSRALQYTDQNGIPSRLAYVSDGHALESEFIVNLGGPRGSVRSVTQCISDQPGQSAGDARKTCTTVSRAICGQIAKAVGADSKAALTRKLEELKSCSGSLDALSKIDAASKEDAAHLSALRGSAKVGPEGNAPRYQFPFGPDAGASVKDRTWTALRQIGQACELLSDLPFFSRPPPPWNKNGGGGGGGPSSNKKRDHDDLDDMKGGSGLPFHSPGGDSSSPSVPQFLPPAFPPKEKSLAPEMPKYLPPVAPPETPKYLPPPSRSGDSGPPVYLPDYLPQTAPGKNGN